LTWVIKDGFVAVIYRKTNAAFEKAGGQIGGQMGGQIGGIIGGVIIEDVLTDRQEEILNLLKENPSISRNQLAEKLDINESAVIKHINSLKKNGEIFSELLDDGMQVSGTETTFEINFAVMKFKHTVTREQKKDKKK
jgi:biotin operon repressor